MLRQLKILRKEKHKRVFFWRLIFHRNLATSFFLFILYDSHYRDYNAETVRNVINEDVYHKDTQIRT